MTTTTAQRRLARAVWQLARRQHWVVARWQLREHGASEAWIRHRLELGRLHPVMRGLYAVGRPELTRKGWLRAAVLRVGNGAFLSHRSAAELWAIGPSCPGPIDVSTTSSVSRGSRHIRIHRRSEIRPRDVATVDGIPVATSALTIVDMATRLNDSDLERMINQADKLELITPDRLRAELDNMPRVPGIARLRSLLDRQTIVLTESELERLFVPIALRAGLPMPLTQQRVRAQGR